MGRMIDFSRRGWAGQNLKSAAHSHPSDRVITSILVVLILFFTNCSVNPSAGNSKPGQTATNLEKGKKGVKVIPEDLNKSAGKRWGICIGINDYDDGEIIDLNYARNDARQLGEILKLYGKFDHIYVFTDGYDPKNGMYPKKNNIIRKLKFLKEIIKPEDMILFSFSGHGISCSDEKGNDEGFLLTVDFDVDDPRKTSLKLKDIVDWIKETNVRKALLLIDACRDKFRIGKGINLNDLKVERFKRFTQAEVVAIIYSTKDGWLSYEDEKSKFGVFTKYIIKGLKGEADTSKAGNGDGIVAFSELVAYVEEGVTNWAIKENKRQRPYTHIDKEKFGDLLLSITTNNQPFDEELLCDELQSNGLIEMIKNAEAYYKVGGDPARREALKLYRSVIERLSERARQALNQELLRRAEQDYEGEHFTHAVREYYAFFKGICKNQNIHRQRN